MGDGQRTELDSLSADQRLEELRARAADRLPLTPSLQRLTREQLEFVTHPLGEPCFLSACPGSGKTEVVGFKLAYEAAAWPGKHSGIAVVTFTRNAAAEIRQRATEHTRRAGGLYPHFVGTLDSWLHGHLLQPFAHSVMGFRGKDGNRAIRIIESSSYAPFLANYITRGGDRSVTEVTRYTLDSQSIPMQEGQPLAADDVIARGALVRNKLAFAQAGFATYDDALGWVVRLLKSRGDISRLFAKRFPFVIVDECQDLAPAQLDLLRHLNDSGVVCHFAGDTDQAIYEFRQVDPSRVLQYCTERMKKRCLTRNFRSDQPIVNFAGTLVGAPLSEGRPVTEDSEQKSPRCILWEYEKDQKAYLPCRFEEILRARGIDPARCAVVARGHTTVDRIRQQTTADGRSADIARALHLWHIERRTPRQMIESMTLMGRVLCCVAYDGAGQSTNQYCPHDLTPMHWRTIIHDFMLRGRGAACFAANGLPQTWTDWVRDSLKPWLKQCWSLLPLNPVNWGDVEAKFRSPDDLTKKTVAEVVDATMKAGLLRITTIHNVKGESLDAVLLVSSRDKKSKGGHVAHWLADPTSENARFAYVACTRPRRLLIIATPPLPVGVRQDLRSRGLSVPPTPDSLFG